MPKQIAFFRYGKKGPVEIDVAGGGEVFRDRAIEDWGRFINVLADSEIVPLSTFSVFDDQNRIFILEAFGDNRKNFVVGVAMRGKAGDDLEWLGGEMATLPDFFLELARGNVANASIRTVFGLRTNIDAAIGLPADVWNGPRALFPWPSGAVALFISSANTADTSVVTVEGSDANNDLISVNVTLAGQTKTRIGTTEQFHRIHRAYVTTGGDVAGPVYIYVDAGGQISGIPNNINSITGLIEEEHQTTLTTMYTIPTGLSGYITNWFAAVNSASTLGTKEADVLFQIREVGQVFRTQGKLTPNNTGSGIQRVKYDVPRKYPSGTDFRMEVASVSTNDTEVSAGYDLILVKDAV